MKRALIISLALLGAWFFLDMTGLYFGDVYLVARSYADDWIFLLAYAICLLSFFLFEKVGKYVLDVWLFLWFMTQFFFHWLFTFNGRGAEKIEYFSGSIKLIEIQNVYIPDLYHIVLHVLILLSLLLLNIYIFQSRKKRVAK